MAQLHDPTPHLPVMNDDTFFNTLSQEAYNNLHDRAYNAGALGLDWVRTLGRLEFPIREGLLIQKAMEVQLQEDLAVLDAPDPLGAFEQAQARQQARRQVLCKMVAPFSPATVRHVENLYLAWHRGVSQGEFEAACLLSDALDANPTSTTLLRMWVSMLTSALPRQHSSRRKKAATPPQPPASPPPVAPAPVSSVAPVASAATPGQTRQGVTPLASLPPRSPSPRTP